MSVSLFAAPTLPRWFWPLLLGLSFVLHAPFFRLPPQSVHVWRQCNTMAVARNFYEESMDILRPRVDRRNTTDGVTGMQFPSYEWLVAGSYHLLGFHESLPRILNWLISLLGLFAFYELTRRIAGAAWLGALAAWGLAWSPEYYYHSINALPDILALVASLAGLLWFDRWRATRQDGWLALSWLAVTLGGLTKLQYLVVGAPIAVFVWHELRQRRLNGPALLALAAYAATAVGLSLSWYAYANALILESGLADFGLLVRPETDPAVAWKIISRNLRSDFPELLLGYGTAALLLVGSWRLIRRWPRRHPWAGPGLVWALALLAYYLLELHQMQGHTYYQFPLLPVLLLAGTYGAAQLAQHRRGRTALLVLLLIQPVWAFARVGWGRWLHGPPGIAPELLAPASRAQLAAAVPAGIRCLVGPDESGCKLFYFLHQKGFGFDYNEQLFELRGGRTYVANCVAQGARYLTTNDTLLLHDARLRPYLRQRVRQVGGFQVWALRAAQ